MNDSVRTKRRAIDCPTLFAFIDAADAIKERVNDALGEAGLSYPKFEVLKHLAVEGGPVSLGILATDQHCARSNITQLIDRLEAEGLVRRVADPDDRRSVRADLTARGAARAREGEEALKKLVAGVESSLSEADRAELDRLVSLMTSRLCR